MNELLHGAAAGALRGGLTAIAYAGVLTLWTVVRDLVTTHVTHTTYGSGLEITSVLVVVVFALFVAFVALAVGGIGGAVVGAAFVPVARRWRGSTIVLCAGCACVAFAIGAIVFPTIPLGWGVIDGFDELVSLKLVPALLSAAAAAWHVASLRRSVNLGRASTPG